MEIHEVSELFPLMSDDDFKHLLEDIAVNGQHAPIWTYQGKIIDGRNRYRACKNLGLAPVTQEWDGKGSLVKFVLSLNLHRRHLSSSQRAAIAVEVEKLIAEEMAQQKAERAREQAAQRERERGAFKADDRKVAILPQSGEPDPEPQRARDQAAQALGTSPRYVQDVKAIKQAAPEIAEKVKQGEMSIPQAKVAAGIKPKQVTKPKAFNPSEVARKIAEKLTREEIDSLISALIKINELRSTG